MSVLDHEEIFSDVDFLNKVRAEELNRTVEDIYSKRNESSVRFQASKSVDSESLIEATSAVLSLGSVELSYTVLYWIASNHDFSADAVNSLMSRLKELHEKNETINKTVAKFPFLSEDFE